MSLRILLAAGLLAALAAPGARADEARRPLSGDAFGPDGDLRYREHHLFEVRASGLAQTTVYRDAGGREIGRMEADYSTYRFAPHYRMVDHRHDTEEIVRRDGSLVHVERRAGEEVRKKTLQIHPDRELIVGPGFNEFIEEHWDELLSGRTLVCDFVIPSRMQIVTFQVSHVADSTTPGHRFRVRVDNFLLRMLAPELNVEYDRETRTLLSYRGPSNVNDDRNESQTVVIRFPSSESVPMPTNGGPQ